MDGINAAGVYFAVRSAFTGTYDYFKYNGEIKITKEAFAIHKNKWQFIELGKKYHDRVLPYALAVSFMYHGTDKMWIEDYLKDFQMHDNLFHEWQTWQENRIENFKIRIDHLAEIYKLHSIEDFRHQMTATTIPYDYYRSYQSSSDKVGLLSTFILLNSMTVFNKMFDSWDFKLRGDFVWDEDYARIKKFIPFFYNYKPISDINLRKTLNLLFPFG